MFLSLQKLFWKASSKDWQGCPKLWQSYAIIHDDLPQMISNSVASSRTRCHFACFRPGTQKSWVQCQYSKALATWLNSAFQEPNAGPSRTINPKVITALSPRIRGKEPRWKSVTAGLPLVFRGCWGTLHCRKCCFMSNVCMSASRRIGLRRQTLWKGLDPCKSSILFGPENTVYAETYVLEARRSCSAGHDLFGSGKCNRHGHEQSHQ